jgi:hypothetical protein
MVVDDLPVDLAHPHGVAQSRHDSDALYERLVDQMALATPDLDDNLEPRDRRPAGKLSEPP